MTAHPGGGATVALTRDVPAAAEAEYDLVVVGGGIYGVAATLSAARRGARVLLMERGDFGGETSWNSLRVLHGGLRYLQTLDLGRFRESVRARSWYISELPELIEPMPCLMPYYASTPLKRLLLGPAIALNEGLRRVWASPDERRSLPAGRLLDADSVAARSALVRPEGLRGGALWYDGSFAAPQRIIMELLRRASASGARALNYVEATACESTADRVTSIRGRDLLADREHAFRTAAILNCAGLDAPAVAGSSDAGLRSHTHDSLAFNLLLDIDLQSDVAVAVSAGGGSQTYFLRPLGGRTLAGTCHTRAVPGQSGPSRGQIEDFLCSLRAAMPALAADSSSVSRVLHGRLLASRQGSAEVATRELFRSAGDHDGPVGLYSLVGIKYTTAPLAAERAVARVLGPAFERRSSSATPPRIRRVPALADMESLVYTDREAATRLVDALVEEESVHSVGDLVLRRTDWGLVPAEEARARAMVHDLRPDLSS